MPVLINLQVVFAPRGTHRQMNQGPIGDGFFPPVLVPPLRKAHLTLGPSK